MSIRSLNGLGGSTNVYVTTLEDGEAIEIEQINNTTQTRANIHMKMRTEEQTTSNENDLMLVADNATGKIVKYTTIRNAHNSLIWKDVDKNEGLTGRNVVLVSPSDNSVVIGNESTNNGNNRKLLVVGNSNQIAFEVYRTSIFRLGEVIVNNDCNLLLRSNGGNDYIFRQNTNLTADRNVDIPLLSNDATMMLDETNVGLKLVNNIIKSGNDNNELINASTADILNVGNTNDELRLISKTTGIRINQNKLIDSASNNIIDNTGTITNVGYPSSSYIQLSGTYVKLGSNKLYDSAGVNLLSKSGSNITIGSSGVNTIIAGVFQSSGNIQFKDITAGASNKIFYNFSGSATTYDMLKITRDASTDANSIIQLGNTTHIVKLTASSNGGILVNTDGGIKVSATQKNMIKYQESLGSYDIIVGNVFDDLSMSGNDVIISAGSIGSPTQFLIANTNGITLGSQNKQLTLRSSSSGILLEGLLKNTNNRTQLEYDAFNTTNIYGTRSTDKSELRGTAIDIVSSADVDFFLSASHPFDTYSVKITSTGNIVLNNDSGIAQSIRTRANNNMIGINSAGNTIDVGHTSTQTNIFSNDAVNLYQGGGTTYNTQFSNGEIKLIKPTGGDIFGDRPTSSSFTTKQRCGNIHCRNIFADNHIYMSYGYWRSFDNGDNSFVVLETYYAGGGGQERDTIRFGTTFDTDVYLSSSNQNKRYALQNNGEIKIYDDSGNQEYIFDRTYVGSERRLKQNIVELDKTNSLNIINNLKPSSYQYKARPNETLTGFIVDEVEGILDEMIFGSTGKDKDGNETGTIQNISKPVLIPTLVSAIQKLNDEINDLKQIIKNNNLS